MSCIRVFKLNTLEAAVADCTDFTTSGAGDVNGEVGAEDPPEVGEGRKTEFGEGVEDGIDCGGCV